MIFASTINNGDINGLVVILGVAAFFASVALLRGIIFVIGDFLSDKVSWWP